MYPTFRWELSAGHPIDGYPAGLDHIGQPTLKRRLDLGLEQKKAATRLGTNAWSLRNWETGRRETEVRFYPAIIRFLGYNPLPQGKTVGEQVRRERTTRGWSRAVLAKAAGVDEATVGRIEQDTLRLARRPIAKVIQALGLKRIQIDK